MDLMSALGLPDGDQTVAVIVLKKGNPVVNIYTGKEGVATEDPHSERVSHVKVKWNDNPDVEVSVPIYKLSVC